MPKKLISFFICMIFLGGCASTQSTGKKDTQIRAYKQDKIRVDQVVQGSLGNWQNSPDVVDDPNRKPTRKVYVVEFSKDADPLPEDAFDVEEFQRQPLSNMNDDDTDMRTNTSSSNNFTTPSQIATTPPQPRFTFPNFDEEDEDVEESSKGHV